MANIFNIKANQSFFDSLIAGIKERYLDEFELAELTILLPSRRACKDIKEAFIRLSHNKVMLLPKIYPIGDIDEEELALSDFLAPDYNNEQELEPLSSLEQKVLLTNLIYANKDLLFIDNPIKTVDQAMHLATELAILLAQLQRDEIEIDNLTNLVKEDLSVHWQEILKFLNIIIHHWPLELASRQKLDPVAYRSYLIKKQTAAWQLNPPKGPIIAAGSTGSIKATAYLLKTIANLPKGAIILPGLDTDISEDDWLMIDEQHSQFNMKWLIELCSTKRNKIKNWSQASFQLCANSRKKLISQLMLPANSCDKWINFEPITAKFLQGIKYITCDSLEQESTIIALLIKEVLTHPTKTAAIITNERSLAKRIISIAKRWQINIDDSAGQPLLETSAVNFLKLTWQMLNKNFAPVELLAALKHPFAAVSYQPQEFTNLIREIELSVLRGVNTNLGIKQLYQSLIKKGEINLAKCLARIQKAAKNLLKMMQKPQVHFNLLLKSHIEFAELLAISEDKSAAERLWASDENQEVADFLNQVIIYTKHIGLISPNSYINIFDDLFNNQAYRPKYGTTPRISILSPIEARFYHQDMIIITSVNEGNWPKHNKTGPWISRGMRKSLNLSLLEKKIGQAALDFYGLSCAKEVVYTRSKKIEGVQTTPSRWILRLEAILKQSTAAKLTESDYLKEWADLLHLPNEFNLILPPRPIPDVELRPNRLSVTDIEKLIKDPYSIYAKHILKLKPLKKINAEPNLAEFGNFVHKALDKFSKFLTDQSSTDNWHQELINCGQQSISAIKKRPAVYNLWWPRFLRIADWIIDYELNNKQFNKQLFTEINGKLKLKLLNKDFFITAKADRFEINSANKITLIDYKTGNIPTISAIKNGTSVQLILEALIATNNAFDCQSSQQYEIAELIYIQLGGGEIAGEFKKLDIDLEYLIKKTAAGVKNLLLSYLDPDTAYLAMPLPQQALKYNDYEHLARIKEWS